MWLVVFPVAVGSRPGRALAQSKPGLARDPLLWMPSVSTAELVSEFPLASRKQREEDTLSGGSAALQKRFRRASLKNNFFRLVSGRNFAPAIEK